VEAYSEHWSEAELEHAAKCAKRLLGPPKPAQGQYTYARAAEDLWPTEIVTIDADGYATRWSGSGTVSGLMIAPLSKGNYGWIQTK